MFWNSVAKKEMKKSLLKIRFPRFLNCEYTVLKDAGHEISV